MLWLNTRMDPYQQYQAPNQGGNPYDFILSPAKPPKKSFGLGGGNSPMKLLLFVVGGVFLLMIVTVLVLNALSGGTNANKADLTALAQTQNEISRVSQAATTNAVQQTTKNLAITIEFSMDTEQKRTTDYLSSKGTKVSAKDLKLKQNATTDQQLSSAKTTSTYDLTYAQIMQTQLTDYSNSLKALYNKTKSKAEQNLLSDFYTQTQLLISQIPYTQNSLQSTGQ